jgi:hypothetical protein
VLARGSDSKKDNGETQEANLRNPSPGVEADYRRRTRAASFQRRLSRAGRDFNFTVHFLESDRLPNQPWRQGVGFTHSLPRLEVCSLKESRNK